MLLQPILYIVYHLQKLKINKTVSVYILFFKYRLYILGYSDWYDRLLYLQQHLSGPRVESSIKNNNIQINEFSAWNNRYFICVIYHRIAWEQASASCETAFSCSCTIHGIEAYKNERPSSQCSFAAICVDHTLAWDATWGCTKQSVLGSTLLTMVVDHTCCLHCGMNCNTGLAREIPAAVGEQLCSTTPEQTGLRGSSRATINHHLSPSSCWNKLPYWIQPEVWSLNWKEETHKDRGTKESGALLSIVSPVCFNPKKNKYVFLHVMACFYYVVFRNYQYTFLQVKVE